MADTYLNPQVLVTAAGDVSIGNPLPCTAAAAGAPATDITVNPVTWMVDGTIVNAANPLPITLA